MSIKQLWQWGNVSTPLKLVFVSCYTHLQCAVSRRNLNSCGVIRVRCFPLVSCCQQREGWEGSMQGHTSLWNERFLVVENGPKHWLVLRLLSWGEIMRTFGSVISPNLQVNESWRLLGCRCTHLTPRKPLSAELPPRESAVIAAEGINVCHVS